MPLEPTSRTTPNDTKPKGRTGRRVSALLAALMALSCGALALRALAGEAPPAAADARQEPGLPGGITLLTYQSFTTTTGDTTVHVATFPGLIPYYPVSNARLKVHTGANFQNHANVIEVKVNGQVVVTHSDITDPPYVYRWIEVRDTNQIMITVAGDAGDLVQVGVWEEFSPLFDVYGPEWFIKPKKQGGGPKPKFFEDTVQFAAGPEAKPAQYLNVVNGTLAGTRLADSLRITLNGQVIVSRADFTAGTIGTLVKPVTLDTLNTVIVRVIGDDSTRARVRFLATDSTAPAFEIQSPLEDAVIGDTLVNVQVMMADTTPMISHVNNWAFGNGLSGTHTREIPLESEGLNLLAGYAINGSGLVTVDTVRIYRDTQSPQLTVSSPAEGFATNADSIDVTGTVSDATATGVTANGIPLSVQAGEFSGRIAVAVGGNVVTVIATDAASNTATEMRNVIRDTTPPALTVSSPTDQLVTDQETLTVSGTVSDALAVTVTANGVGLQVESGAFSGQISLVEGPNTVIVRAEDAAGNAAADTLTVTLEGAALPPDPATVAPDIDPTVATNLFDATRFLYEGPDSIQKGVAPGTIVPQRAAVIRGRVLDREGNVLSGVKVAIAGDADYGFTTTRTDGMYDLAVNGGGPLTVDFTRSGYLPGQRTLEVPWQDYVVAPDIRLVAPDTAATVVDLTDTTTVRIAQSSSVSDADGARQMTLMFAPATVAEVLLPGGGIDTLTSGTVRVTEYTIGDAGPEAMPAMLPPSSRYTYAAELTIDEANGAEVSFSEPVSLFLDNFLELDPGTIVPVGFYDREAKAWIAGDNGRVIEIVAITSDTAEIDLDGDGNAESPATLAAAGISDDERIELATLYSASTTLWWVEVPHFSTIDLNFPQGEITADDGDTDPSEQAEETQSEEQKDEDDPCDRRGHSILECDNQILGERIAIVGTPYTLDYRSDRVPGRRSAFRIDIPLTGDSVSSLVQRVELRVSVAGQVHVDTFPPLPNQSTTFEWDGQDGYGRTVQGQAMATVRVSYVLSPVNYWLPAATARSFGLPCYDTTFAGGDPRVLCEMAVNPISGARLETARSSERIVAVGVPDQSRTGLGGWSISPHHMADPTSRATYFGDGKRRRASERTREHVAGTGNFAFSGDGGPATEADIGVASGLAAGPDGSIHFMHVNAAMRRIDPDGTIDSLPFDSIGFGFGTSVAAGPDGSVYAIDQDEDVIVRRAADGALSVVAGLGGDCSSGSCGDGNAARDAGLHNPVEVAFAADGTMYIAESNTRIRTIDPSGVIRTVASKTSGCSNDDGISAADACIGGINGIDVSEDGTIVISLSNPARIRKIDPAGLIWTVAGGGTGSCGDGIVDGGPAVGVTLCSTQHPRFIEGGTIVFSDQSGALLRAVLPDGSIRTLSDCETISFCIEGVAVAPDGTILINNFNRRIYRLRPPSSAQVAAASSIASRGGSEVYEVDATGRHASTRDVRTGTIKYGFGYEGAGRLSTITDMDSLVTTVQRDSLGRPTGILSPYDQLTTLELDSLGMIERIVNPAGDTTRFEYTADGLLTTMIDPNGHVRTYTYLADGRLASATSPDSGTASLGRTDTGRSASSTVTTALGRTTRYERDRTADDLEVRRVISPAGDTTTLTTRTQALRDASISTRVAPDSTVTESFLAGDARFGLTAPRLDSMRVRMPSGLTLTTRARRSVVLADASDPLSLLVQTDTVRINGRPFVSQYVDSTLTLTATTPTGRTKTTRLDSVGRTVADSVAGLTPWAYEYDEDGRLTQAQHGSRTWEYAYDTLGRLETVTDPLARVVAFEYDLAGRMTRQVLPDSTEIAFGYDRNSNMTSLTPPDRPVHTFSYDAVNQAQSYTAPSVEAGSSTTGYTFDLDRQLTEILRPDSIAIAVAYDSAGRVESVTIPRGTYGFSYHAATGQLTAITSPDSIGLGYIYDGALLTAVQWTGEVSGSVDVSYDSDFRVVKQRVNAADSVAFGYDDDGLLTSAGAITLSRNAANGLLTGTTLGSVTTGQSYNAFGELASYSAAYAGDTLFHTEYTRDALGRITRLMEAVEGVTDTLDYMYDPVGRLVEVQRNGAVVESYGYNANGNRTSFTGPGGMVTGTYDHQDRMLTHGNASYTYTSAGELASKIVGTDTTLHSYDSMGNLVEVRLPDGTEIGYLIDGQDRRVGRTVGGQLRQGLLYGDQLNPVAELDSLGQVVSRFVYGSRINVPEYMVKGGVAYRLVTDHLGSVRLVVNVSTGVVVQRIDYDAYGRVVQDTEPGFQPFGYAGGITDAATGLVRFGARDYDPVSGRWTAKDPIGFGGGSSNLYAYAGGDPIGSLDPSGLFSVDPSCLLARVSLALSVGADAFLALKMLKAAGAAGRFLIGSLNFNNGARKGLEIINGTPYYVFYRKEAVDAAGREASKRGGDVLRDIRRYTLADVIGEEAGALSSIWSGQRDVSSLLKDAALGLVPFFGSIDAYEDVRSRCRGNDGDSCPIPDK
jgi:RHS repeat-associated protein